MYQVKQKIQSNLLDEESNLLKILERYFLIDIDIFYHVVKISFIKKNMLRLSIGENNIFIFQMVKLEKGKTPPRKLCSCLMSKWSLTMKNLRSGIENCLFWVELKNF
jgi:hypothetical protein